MPQQLDFGTLNEHALGIILKEIVSRAIETIRAQIMVFEVDEKIGYNGDPDVVTSADKAAQAVYVKLLQQSFPSFGIIAEEKELSIACTEPDHNIYFTVDPLDGTKAFTRRQSHGIGTMLALVCDGRVIASVVGDIMTKEIYYFRPYADKQSKVYRISGYGKAQGLLPSAQGAIATRHIQLRSAPWKYSRLSQELFRRFRDIEIACGSIGVSTARLWKGEIGAQLLLPNMDTPWDQTPLIGFAQKLKIRYFLPDENSDVFVEFSPLPPTRITTTPHEVLMIHEILVPDLIEAGFI